jgi:type II secretory pathway pseudopilin PulG
MNNLNSERIRKMSGSSLVEMIIAMAITGVVASVIVVTSGSIVRRASKVGSERNVIYFRSDVLTRVKSLMLDVEGVPPSSAPTLKNTQGLCSVMKTEAVSFGTNEIYFDLRNEAVSSFLSPDDWERAFLRDGTWEIYNSSDCASGLWSKCFRLRKNSPLYKQAQSEDIDNLHVKAEIIPVSIDPYSNVASTPGEESSSGVFQPLNMNQSNALAEVDVKKVAFIVSAESIFDHTQETGETIRKQVNYRSLIWAADLSQCDFQAIDGRVLKLSPTGTGLGDPVGEIVYNSTDFRDDKPPIEIFLNRSFIQRRTVEDGTIRNDPTQNAETACVEMRYKCPNQNGNRRFSNTLALDGGIFYNPASAFGERPIVAASFKTSIVGQGIGDLTEIMNVRERFFVGGEEYRRVDNKVYAVNGDEVDMQNELELRAGRNPFEVVFEEAEPMCQRICNGEGNTFFPQFDYTLFNLGTEENPHYSSTARRAFGVACSICAVKSCSRVGVNTFTDFTNISNEPLDSVYPVCVLNETAELRKAQPVRTQDIQDPGNGECVAGRLDASSNTIVFQAMPCGEQLPALCYNFGSHRVARKVLPENGYVPQVQNVTYEQAQRACFEMGLEVLARDKFQGFYSQSMSTEQYENQISPVLNNIPVVDEQFRFYNNAKAGSFFAPITNELKESAAVTTSISQNFSDGTVFWVGMRKDSHGTLRSMIPFAQNSFSAASDQFASYYGPVGLPELLSVFSESSLGVVRASTGDRALMIANHVFLRGAIGVAKNQTRDFRYLCRRKSDFHEFFLSSGAGTSFASGFSICESSGGVFAAPLSPLEWLRVLEMINPSHPDLPFPDPGTQAAPNIPTLAWVALETTQAGNTDHAGWRAPTPANLQHFRQSHPFVDSDEESQEKFNKLGYYERTICNQSHMLCESFADGLYRWRTRTAGCSASERQVVRADLDGLVNRTKLNMAWAVMPNKTVFGFGGSQNYPILEIPANESRIGEVPNGSKNNCKLPTPPLPDPEEGGGGA